MPHISECKIENYKKLDTFILKDIGRINLITGDNNIGKTTLLESLLVNDNLLYSINFIHKMLCERGIHAHLPVTSKKSDLLIPDYFKKYILNNSAAPLIINYKLKDGSRDDITIFSKKLSELSEIESRQIRKFDYDKLKDVPYYFVQYINNTLKEVQPYYLDDLERKHNDFLLYWPFIWPNTEYSPDLHEFYLKVQLDNKFSNLNIDKRDLLIEYLQLFDNRIEKVELIKFEENSILGVLTRGNKNFFPITRMGSGFIRYFRIVLELLYIDSKDGLETRFFIDEIDNGIHFTKMKGLWKSIFELVLRTNIQLFVTTHSLECLESYAIVANEFEDLKSHIRQIELEEIIQDGKSRLISSTYSLDLIQSGLDSGINLRGGDLWRN